MKEMNGICSFVKKEKEVKMEFLLKPEITLNVDMRMAYVGIPVNAFTSSSPSKLPISLKKTFFNLSFSSKFCVLRAWLFTFKEAMCSLPWRLQHSVTCLCDWFSKEEGRRLACWGISSSF